jgi:peptide subunit release factor 1 (eRF1)
MGARKRVQKIPQRVTLKCPKCHASNRVEVPLDRIINSFQCKNCKEEIRTPISSCCVICAFSNKKCPTNLLIEAKAKNLEVRIIQKENKENPKIFTRDDFHPPQ